MVIKRISQHEGDGSKSYTIYSDRDRVIMRYSSKEVGEIVGYTNDSLLCLQGGKYYIRTLEGKTLTTFFRFTSPYPLQITIPIVNTKVKCKVKNEEEEMLYRAIGQRIKEVPGETVRNKIENLLSCLIEAQITCDEVVSYISCQKDLTKFLKKEISRQHSIIADEEKEIVLLFSLASTLVLA